MNKKTLILFIIFIAVVAIIIQHAHGASHQAYAIASSFAADKSISHYFVTAISSVVAVQADLGSHTSLERGLPFMRFGTG